MMVTVTCTGARVFVERDGGDSLNLSPEEAFDLGVFRFEPYHVGQGWLENQYKKGKLSKHTLLLRREMRTFFKLKCH